MEIDELDKKILNVLLKNSRSSYRDIAKKVGVSFVTVIKRVQRLENEKIIKSYSANIDYEKLGYDLNVLIKMRVSQGKSREVGKKLAQEKNVSAMYNVTGDFDDIILAKFKDRKSMDIFLKNLQSYEHIERTETSLVLNTLNEKNILVE
jgi:Lrp/AsnC family transcriptional regulator for asnA, asnC and gidA